MVIKVKYNGEQVKIPYLSSDHGQELVEEAPKDGSQYARQNGVWSVVNIPEVDFTEVYNAIDTKVDKVEGKSLSTNDYVTADKTKVTNINEVIEAATKNVTATDISITLDKRNLVTNVVENIELNLPASTTALAGLMLPADKIKLNGIAAGAEVNVNADWNATEGDALILNKPTLSTVATSGSYNDLTEKPTIPTVDVNKEYVDTQLATLISGLSKSNTKQLTIYTTGDGTKSLMDDGKYRKLPVYGRNLVLGSGKEVSNSNYNIANYWLAEQIPEGAQVTVTIWGELGGDKSSFNIYTPGGSAPLTGLSKKSFAKGKASVTVLWGTTLPTGGSSAIGIYTYPSTVAAISTIYKIKLEYGDISTEWTPAWEDIPDLEERYAYGVEWDTASSSPDGVRVGNMQLHRELPIQSKMRGVILDNDGGVKEYLNNSSWTVSDVILANNEPLLYSVLTEIPEHYYKLYTNGTKFRMMLSAIPLPGYNHVDKFYISSYEARLRRSSEVLFSGEGTTASNTDSRGGNNTADWDGTYRSLLGRPVTNLTRDQFRQAARKRGSGWEMYTYNAHKTLFWLFAVEYATLDSQKPFNAQKDANGFAQGGLGPGPTQMTDWTNFNNSNPLIPCGYTNEFGNGSGEKAYVVKNASGGTHATLMANRYRGIENPFGHIWKYTDGANIQVTTGDSGLSILWTTDDPSNFSDTSYTGYDKKGNICRTNGYAKKMLLGEDGDIVATEIGGSSSTYWCDYYYTYTSANRMQVVLVGGAADYESNAGLARVHTLHAPSNAYRDIGSRLCFFPKYKSTEIITTTE